MNNHLAVPLSPPSGRSGTPPAVDPAAAGNLRVQPRKAPMHRFALACLTLCAALALGTPAAAATTTTVPPACLPAPTFHSYETFTAPPGACYDVPRGGVVLRHLIDVNIVGGTWHDTNKSPCPFTRCPEGSNRGRPAFDVIFGGGIAFKNLTITGVNNGGYHEKLAFNAGIEAQGTYLFVLTNVHVSHVFGDCLDLEPIRSGKGSNGIVAPSEGDVLHGFTASACGRQGITLASVIPALLTNVTIGSTGFNSLDFEADVPDEGAQYVTVDGCSLQAPVNISGRGPATGPDAISHCTIGDGSGSAVIVHNPSGAPDNGPVMFAHDTFRCGASAYVSCFRLQGTTAAITDSTAQIGFKGDALREPIYGVSAHSFVLLQRDAFTGYYAKVVGSHDATSSVRAVANTFTPGR